VKNIYLSHIQDKKLSCSETQLDVCPKKQATESFCYANNRLKEKKGRFTDRESDCVV
jgi:hypothetical protein